MKKKVFQSGLMLLLVFSICSCGKLTQPLDNASTAERVNRAEEIEKNELVTEEANMKLFINNDEIPVIWEQNTSVYELMDEVEKGEIVVDMSMYGGNEQVGSLGKRYSSNDKQTTTHNGDIVLYSSSNLVVFYGSNSWTYTRLGKIDLSDAEITKRLSNGDVTITIKK